MEQMQAQRQAQLERLALQRQASAQYENHHIDGPRPQPGQGQAHSAFEHAAQQTPPPAFREPGPAKQTVSGRSGGSIGGALSGGQRNSQKGAGGSPHNGGSSGSFGDQALLERMPSRPRASRPSPTDPRLKLAAAVAADAMTGNGAGEVSLGGKDRDVAARGGSGRSSTASAASGFQPYNSGALNGGAPKRSISGPHLHGELFCGLAVKIQSHNKFRATT